MLKKVEAAHTKTYDAFECMYVCVGGVKLVTRDCFVEIYKYKC